MFKSFKAKLLGFVGLATAFATSASAEVLTAEQKTQLTTSLTSAYSEYMGLLIAVVAVSAAFYLIATFARRLGKGRNGNIHTRYRFLFLCPIDICD